ncbi:inactive polypeptide N-acetylgalactosaminyltransferase-like protein 5 [Diadema setosum]|uniref:inactive polypeptide N-acetylgalactosaminyltransferase-like protein 5 n=1 Tax=Diadema setosum TaxID=31175 RepID=UPI003B3B2939
MPRIYFTVVVSGTAWFSLAFLLFLIHHESRDVLRTVQQGIVADVPVNSGQVHDGGGGGGGHHHFHAHPSEGNGRRSNAHSREEKDLDPILGQIDKDIPRFGPGEGGQPVLLSGEALGRAKLTRHLHNYNLVVSDKISVERSVLDTRNQRCQDITYKFSNLPSATVIIAFHNEAWSTLMRTVHSVINRTPRDVLKEVILVNDASDDDELQKKLRNIPPLVRSKVRLIHSKQREGVTRANLRGAKEARGEVLVFLESHCEVNTHWLEPMLDLIHQGPTTVVSPIVDPIDADTFAYRAAPLARHSFRWNLEPRSVPLSKIEIAERLNPLEPVRSPLLSGGIFAVAKSFYDRVGGLDGGLTGFSEAGIDFSFKAWMCGGSVYVVPCSRVGRISLLAQPTSDAGADTSSRDHDSIRIAESWMDTYLEEFYSTVPGAKDRYFGDISDITKRKEKLNCHNFAWYLNHVAPSLLATSHRTKRAWGQIQNREARLCLTAPSGGEGKKVILDSCHSNANSQMLLMTKDYEIRFEELCLDLSDYRFGQHVTIEECHGMGGSQAWIHSKPGHIQHRESELCLDISAGRTYKAQMVTNECNERSAQNWEFSHYSKTAAKH